jgi:hypothetical protein
MLPDAALKILGGVMVDRTMVQQKPHRELG